MSRNPTTKEVTSTIEKFKKMFPAPGAMEVGNAFQSLVAIILSARTRDEQVLKLLPAFFSSYPTPERLAKASVKDIERKIGTIGMFRQKAKNLKAMARRVVDEYNGKIPDNIDDLTTLAGVGRKTASVLLPYAFNKPAIAVDTHVHRVTNRLAWVQTKTPDKTEEKLLKLIPKRLQATVNRVFVKFGRYICLSPKPRCWACPLVDICEYKDKNLQRPKNAEEILEDIERRENELQKLRAAIQ
ncbi:endonuclease III [Patescibacteria group bacterium]|nr:endonuclease III [Patescibacteria group bacterium]